MTVSPDDDAALMLRVQGGDLPAFEAIVEKYRLPVFNFVHRTLRDAEEAEDIAQQVFLQAWKAAGRYRVASRFSTWLFTIARNLCLNELRRRGRHRTDSLDAPIEAGGAPREREIEDCRSLGVTGTVLLEELGEKIEEALADLPESQRSAILLLREKEMAYEDIAVVLGVSVSAVKSLIHRGRETLKHRIKGYLLSGSWEDRHAPGQA
jgi:RNA polymerase sigma-70 factor (ECF subfamily)